jgi:hypothetical protein
VEIGELGEFVGGADTATSGAADVVLHRRFLRARCLELTLAHLVAVDDQVGEDAEERQEDDEDRPDGLRHATHVVAADDVAEDREDQHDPHEEQEEPQDRPEDLSGSEFSCK